MKLVAKKLLSRLNTQISNLIKIFFKDPDTPGILRILCLPCIILFQGFFGLFLTTIQRIISPVLLIRVGRIYNQRIGHFILEFDWLQTVKPSIELGFKKRFPIHLDLFFLSGKSSNSFLEKIVRENIRIVPRILILGLYLINRISIGGQKYLITFPTRPTDFRYLNDTSANYTFTNEEHTIAKTKLRGIGFDPEMPVICFYIRDSAYAKKYFAKQDQDFAMYRDCDLHNFQECMKFLADSGYQIFRMGKYGAKPLLINHPRIFDYTFSSIRSDFMDFYITSMSDFAVATDSGAMMLPIFFRKPLLLVNVPAFHGLISGKCLTLFQFKTFREVGSGAEITLNELIQKGAIDFESYEKFKKAGIELHQNTSDELLQAVKEMLDIILGKENREAKYGATQSLLNSILSLSQLNEVSGKLSLSWLKRHPSFLD